MFNTIYITFAKQDLYDLERLTTGEEFRIGCLQLVLVASKRARQLTFSGEDPFVDWDNDKATVVALREIADGFVDKKILSQRE